MTPPNANHACLWQNGIRQDIGTLGGNAGGADDINELGYAVGSSRTSSGLYHAFFWQNGSSMQDLGTLPGGWESTAYAINYSGQVAGSSLTSSGDLHACLWQNGGIQDLGTLGGNWSDAYAINDNGQVVGTSSTSSGDLHAFLWQNGKLYDLNELVVNKSNVTFTMATGINEHGWIVGHTSDEHAFLITPITNVSIDIKPGSYPNSINLGSEGNVPVAIFSTADFDATQVDPATVTLASAPIRLKGKSDTFMTAIKDVNQDGLPDLLVHIDTTALKLVAGDQQAVLEGKTYDGRSIQGTDTVRIVP